MGNSIYSPNSNYGIRDGMATVQPMPGQVLYGPVTGQGSGGYILQGHEYDRTDLGGLEAQLDGRFLDTSYDEGILSSNADVRWGDNNKDCVLTYNAAGIGKAHVLSGITWGYSATPSGYTTLRIEDGSGNAVFAVPVTAAGAGFHNFIPKKRFTENSMLRVILSGGGNGVSGVISGMGHAIV